MKPTPAPLPLAVTMGEPAGLGPELTARLWQQRDDFSLPSFFVTADPDCFAAADKAAGTSVPIQVIDRVEEVVTAFDNALPVLPLNNRVRFTMDRPNPVNAGAVIEAIERAVTLVHDDEAGAVVTNPIQKSSLIEAGFAYSGHTDFLGKLSHTPTAPVMMLTGPHLRCVPVTVHIPLAAVFDQLNPDLLSETILTTAKALSQDFGIDTPRIAVAGLNPHAGEDGHLGSEDQLLIAPVVANLAKQGLHITGPHPADTLFHAAARQAYDVAVCMYHDQALIPLKTLDFDAAVNVTLGLDFIRTSPDHGTGLDLVGTGRASTASLCAAIKLAAEMAMKRAAH